MSLPGTGCPVWVPPADSRLAGERTFGPGQGSEGTGESGAVSEQRGTTRLCRGAYSWVESGSCRKQGAVMHRIAW